MTYCNSEAFVFDLKPCPFCGKNVAEVYDTIDLWDDNGLDYDGVNKYTIICNFKRNGCGATCGYHDTIDQAVSRWNTRVVI